MHSDIAEEGFYKTRLHRRGPWVAAAVWMDEGKMRAYVDGSEVEIEGEAPKTWPWRRITQQEFDYMTRDAEWCRRHAPGDPKSTPWVGVNLRKMRAPF